ncbi:hypothetical protein JRQ81_002015 [Phrynocephalus forsythii]|uniref:NADH dehydrogenase [ubiquinone] 1 beta subcomplex subunit 4 n=1 Tax=Phrynocephalus forsythii TaxID=171643 RepID=A0A9Q1AWA4_9SAUR|nr:hypothetical protein JRQ81_002015 [Phrynocephalus forsythii]
MDPPTPLPGCNYRPAPLASLPETLDANYYKASPERRRAEAERLAIRARLKYEYQLKLNDPHRVGLIDHREKLIKEGKYERTIPFIY